MASHFLDAINVFEGISGTESFFEEWNSHNKSVKALLQERSLQIALCAIDTHILKAAFCDYSLNFLYWIQGGQRDQVR